MHTQIARSVRFPIVAGKKVEFTKLFNDKVLPLLRSQDGFKNEIMMINDDHVIGVSVWSGSDSLQKYATVTYPKVEQILSSLMSGKPQIENFELTAVNALPA